MTDPIGSLLGVVMVLTLVGFTAHAVAQLVQHHPGDVQTVCYFFCLSLVLTTMIALWAVQSGAVDERGYHGSMGGLLQVVVEATTDLPGDVLLLLAIVGVVLVPQWLSYLLSGVFGCASTPLFIEASTGLVFWGVAKSLVVVAGLLIPLAVIGPKAIVGSGHPWWTVPILAAMLVGIAFWVLLAYRSIPMLSKRVIAHTPEVMVQLCHRFHASCTRHRR